MTPRGIGNRRHFCPGTHANPAIHYGVSCDRSGQCPIVGTRYKVSFIHVVWLNVREGRCISKSRIHSLTLSLYSRRSAHISFAGKTTT